jgi:uncharacterized protein YjbI with pentapeptide repeats
MAKTNGGKRKTSRTIDLPDLTELAAGGLEPGFDYDATAFTDRDFTGQDAADARFLDCRMDRCCVEGLTMRRARIVNSVLSEIHGASLDLADSNWRDAEMTGGRLGAMVLAGATLLGVRIRGIKFDFVNMSAAKLDDVVFEDCEIGSLDARASQLRSVAFIDCDIRELDVAEAGLTAVDLTRARLQTLIGVESLRGAIVTRAQLFDLAPLLAVKLGIEVRGES